MTASLTRASAAGVSARNLDYLDEHLRKYISAGTLAGTLVVVYRRGQIAHWSTQGQRDRERNKPMTDDTIFRIYSMTKPIVSVALMQLYERGLVQLDDPVHRYIPSWKDLRVYQSGTYPNFQTVPCERPMTVRDLLTHQSGLTYGFMNHTNVDAAYRQLKVGGGGPLQEMVDALAGLPLEFSPGTAWNYSHATDIVGYLVEVISGQPLDSYLQEQIFGPLGMTDTAFWVRPEQADRFATNYAGSSGGGLNVVDDAATSPYLKNPAYLSGGGGLVSTAGDYLRFCQMLLGKGTLDGTRIIGRKTLELMTQNHITGGKSVAAAATTASPMWREPSHQGSGFGLGFAVTLDTADGQLPGSPGSFSWSGAAGTQFWIDPTEDLAVVFMTQYFSLASNTRLNIGRELRSIIYGALD